MFGFTRLARRAERCSARDPRFVLTWGLALLAPLLFTTTAQADARSSASGPFVAVRAELDRLIPGIRAIELAPLREGDIAVDANVRLLRWEQRFHGLAVLGRGATLRLDARSRSGAVARARLETRLPARLAEAPTVTADAAATIARDLLRARLDPGAAELAIAPLEEGGVLVWRFQPRFGALPFAPEILIDARTGQVRIARDRALSVAPPRARVFASNPVRAPGVEPLTFPIAPAQDHLESGLIVAKTCVDKGGVEKMPGVPNGIRICDLVSTARPGTSGDYDSPPLDEPDAAGRNEDTFAETSMYYHLGRVYAFFESLAPPGTKSIVAARPFLAVANLRLAPGLDSGDDSHIGDPQAPLAPYSNAFYAPGNDGFGDLYGVKGAALWFGQGPRRDYAYDGDVVYHEFTHAIVDATLGLGSYAFDSQGLSAAPGALNEGLADLFSSALAGDPDVGEYAAADVGDQRFVRTLANDDRCPARFVGEVHFDSTTFSGALWAARASLSPLERVVFDRALYETLLTNPKFDSPTFEEFIEVMLETFRLRSSLAVRALETELSARGLYPACERLFDASDHPVVAASDAGGRLAFQSPGKFATGLSLVPGVATFRSALEPGRLQVRFAGRTRSSSGSGIFADGQGSPFAPTVLARFDSPLTFHGANHNANATIAAKAEGTQWLAELPIPAGAQTVYVQIANGGELSGLYDGVRISVVPVAIDAGEVPTTDAPIEAPGSNCTMGASEPKSGGLGVVSGVALAAALAVRRRRRR